MSIPFSYDSKFSPVEGKTLKIPGLTERLLIAIGGERRGNQKKAAERLGIRESVLGGWIKENKDGKRRYPSAEHLKNIHDKLGINLNWLIAGEGPAHIPAANQVAERQESYAVEKRAISSGDDETAVLAAWKQIPVNKRQDAMRILKALAEKEEPV